MTIRANSGFSQFLLGFVWIVNPLLDESVISALAAKVGLSAIHDVLLTVFVSGLRQDGYPAPRDSLQFRLISAAEYHLYLNYRPVFKATAYFSSISGLTVNKK